MPVIRIVGSPKSPTRSRDLQENRVSKFISRVSTLLLLSCCSALAAEDRSDANTSCRQETKRVVVWPHGSPKAPPMARIENRQVTVCDPKVSQQVISSNG